MRENKRVGPWPHHPHGNQRQRSALSECAEGEWVRSSRAPFAELIVASLVPAVFEAYARILHPALSASQSPVSWRDVAGWSGRLIHGLAQWEMISHPVTTPEAPPPFASAPQPGALPALEFDRVREIIAGSTKTPGRCFFAAWDGYGWLDWSDTPFACAMHFGPRGYLVVEDSIDGSPVGWHTDGRFVRVEPTLLWPADRAWFVASDPDLDSTYVGGTLDLIATIAAQSDLEAFPMIPADDLSAASDVLNR